MMPDEPILEAKRRVNSILAGMRDEIAAATSELVRIRSVNPRYPGCNYAELVGGESAANRRLAYWYEEAGCEIDWIEPETGRANLVGTVAGKARSGSRSLAFNGHIDTVPVGNADDWASGDPWSGSQRDGRIFGRGASDQKGGLVSSAMAAIALRRAGAALRGDLILESVVGEEVGEHDIGINAVIARHIADAAIVTEPTAPVVSDPDRPPFALQVAPISAGLLWMTLDVVGKAGHNNLRPELVRAGGVGSAAGVNAIEKAVYLLNRIQDLEQQWGQKYLHPLFKPGHFTLHPGVIIGGPRGVLVPFFISEFCRIEYSILYPPDISSDVIRHEIETFVTEASRLDPWLRANPAKIIWNLDWKPSYLDPAHPLCELLARIRREAVGEATHDSAEGLDPRIRGFDAVCDATYLNASGIAAVVCGPGSIQYAHAVNESVSVDQLHQAARLFAFAAIEWCGVE